MATGREQDILRLIRENPLIAQQDIAERCGITRSSVAVHISNLMKKGLIQGKGYILQEEPYAAVVGGANMDIGGRSAAALVPRDSNPGTATFSPGGVGRNIAHNLALLGCGVRMVSAFGDDVNGATLAESCRKAGVDITASPVLAGETTAVYLYITNEQGEMELAVNDMGIYGKMTPAFLAARMDTINRAALCVADTNPPLETLEYLAAHCAVPLVVDPVSTVKAQRIKGLLPRVHTLKCNRAEAAVLSGVAIDGEQTLRAAAQKLMADGVTQMVITMGAEGALCAGPDGIHLLPAYLGVVANVTGGGDAFTAALAAGLIAGLTLAEAAQNGLAAGALAVTHRDTIHPGMSAARVAEIVQKGGL
ncbi:PfkB family carbohydrate kinase [Ruminococcaceae bacterium OttesenSCG-928-A11]|nr:PfkB family carbohydrate kinase [Ruminococcaceae bacterium OttesenSCG-928-A11]